MKYRNSILFFISIYQFSCNNGSSDQVEKADSINKARLDSGLNRNAVVVDENSSNFLVRAAAHVGEVYVVSEYYKQEASSASTKDFVHKIAAYHKSLADSIVALASQKNIFLAADSTIGLEVISQFKAKAEKQDKNFLSYIIKTYEKTIPMFENAILDTKDLEIRSFADKTIPSLRSNLEPAKELIKKL